MKDFLEFGAEWLTVGSVVVLAILFLPITAPAAIIYTFWRWNKERDNEKDR